jgi:hypothetical protein
MARTPVSSAVSITRPVEGSRSTGLIPKKGRVADPAFVGVHPGRGLIMMLPVSVCQYYFR